MGWEDILKLTSEEDRYNFNMEEAKHFADAIERDNPNKLSMVKKLEMAGFDFRKDGYQKLNSDIFGYDSLLIGGEFSFDEDYDEGATATLEFRLKISKDRKSLTEKKMIYPTLYVYFGPRGDVGISVSDEPMD